jgi:Domain of unknown function (DUF4911)
MTDTVNRKALPGIEPPAAMAAILLAIPPAKIAQFKAIIESYDNLATLRTHDPRRHYLMLYFAPAMRTEINALLSDLTAEFGIVRLA